MRKQYDFSKATCGNPYAARFSTSRGQVEPEEVPPLTKSQVREIERRRRDSEDRTRHFLATTMRTLRSIAAVFILSLPACASARLAEPHPGVAERWGRFLSMPHQRAFAVAGDPNGRWAGAVVGGYPSPIEAEHEALRRCERERLAAGIEPACQIYATGHRIVWPDPGQ